MSHSLDPTKARIKLPPKLIPLFDGEADVRAAYGGRGSGKTRSFAMMSAVRAYVWDQAGREGIILCGRQFMNSLDESSMEEVKAAIRSEPWLEEHFDIGEKYIRTKSRRISYKFTGLDRNVDSLKSKARILLAWIDEADPVSDEAYEKLIPTLREVDSELWVTWNPERKSSATDQRFRKAFDPRMKTAEINWRDNPMFPAILDRVRVKDRHERPDRYAHIWDGDYDENKKGAYYASLLADAKREGRIGFIAKDPLMRLRAYWDLGGRGMKSDATTIWIAQFIDKEIRVLDYYEAVGQPLAAHVDWMRTNKYDKALCVLPHDGAPVNPIADRSWQTALEDIGFEVEVVENQGPGAARMRIEAARRLFPRIQFNDKRTQTGRDRLGWYHEKWDEKANVGLGPMHDESSHAADSFGLMCVAYVEPVKYEPMPEMSYDWVA